MLAIAAAEIEDSAVLTEPEFGAKPLGTPRAKAPRERKRNAANRISDGKLSLRSGYRRGVRFGMA
jgi:hypothetical protein